MKDFINKIKNNDNIMQLICFVFCFVFAIVLSSVFKAKSNAVNIVVMCGILLLCSKALIKYGKEYLNRRTNIVSLVFSCLFSIALTAQSKITFSGSVFGNIKENTIDGFSFFDIPKFLFILLGTLVIYNSLYIFIEKVSSKCFNSLKVENDVSMKAKKKEAKEKNNLNKSIIYWLIITVIIFVPIFIFWLSFYPGFVPQDAIISMNMTHGKNIFSTHHPLIFTLIMSKLLDTGIENDFSNYTPVAYNLIQMICFSGTVGYFVLWLRNKGVKKDFLFLTVVFFIGSSFIYTYAVILWKDIIFSLALLLMALLLYDIIKSDGNNIKKPINLIGFLLLSFIIFAWRNNGVYIVSLIALFLIFKLNKKVMGFHIINLCFIFAFIIAQRTMYTSLKVKDKKEEAIGIPLQQIARTISVSGDIADKDLEFLNNLLPIEMWKSNYTPMSVDHIKWAKKFNVKEIDKEENFNEFLNIWFRTLPKNFGTYVESYLLNTYGFWSFGTNNAYEAGFDDYRKIVNNKYGFEHTDLIEEGTGIPLHEVYGKTSFIGSGTMFWIMMFAASILFIKKMNSYSFACLPCFASWLTLMIATPVAFALRYTFMFVLTMPLFVFLIIKKEN